MTGVEQAVADAGSFRDRNGRVYSFKGRVFRGLSQTALKNFSILKATGFYRRALEKGHLVSSQVLDPDDVPLPAETVARWAGWLEHESIPVISYPYEWSFDMLRDAALLQLELQKDALLEGMSLKDATPYNIQFDRGRPRFIDIPSFEPWAEGSTWQGYRQFCEMFLFPLMVQAYLNEPFQSLMRSSIEGITIRTASNLFGFWDRFKPGVFSHVWLQSKFERRYGSTQQDVRTDIRKAGFNKELILANVGKLIKLVSRMKTRASQSEWGDYEEFHNYTEIDHRLKAQFVDRVVASSQPQTLWDIGCNTGRFSKIAAKYARHVVAMDLDHEAINRLYKEIRLVEGTNILPLVHNLADPSPMMGWRNLERTALPGRSKPQLIMCLALTHHVVISANIPLEDFIDWLASLGDELIIEYVSRTDDKVKSLLRNREDQFSDYSRKGLEAALSSHFTIVETLALKSGNRFLYWCRKSAQGSA